MPNYNASISLNSHTVFPGEEIDGRISFTAARECTLKAAKLEVVCHAIYHHQGGRRYRHEQPNIVIPLMHNDGMRAVQREERLTRVHRPTVFTFRAQLPADLLPSTSGRCREVLDVSYTLKLSSRRGFFGSRKEDAAIAFQVVALLNLRSQPFSEMAYEEVVVHNMQFGQGIDLMASAHIPRLGWESLQTVPVKLNVSRISNTDSYCLVLYLERTISYRARSTTTDIVESRPVRIPSEAGPYKLNVVIPDDTPVTGVMYCPTLCVHYRLRVEIKSTVNGVPTFVLALPLVIGTKRQLLTASLSWDEGGSKTDLLRDPGHGGVRRRVPPAREAYSSHEPQSGCSSASVFSRSGRRRQHSVENSQSVSSMERPTMLSSIEAFSDMQSTYSGPGRRHPRSGGHTTVPPVERPTVPSSMEASSDMQSTYSGPGRRHPRSGEGHTTVPPVVRPTMPSSGTSSGRPAHCPTPTTDRARAAEDSRPTRDPPRDIQTTAPSADTGYPPAGHQLSASVDTQTSLQWPYPDQQPRQQPSLASEGPPSTSATSHARLSVANPSSQSSSGATSYTAPSSQEDLLSLESSGPQAMGPAGHAHVFVSPLMSAHHTTHKKQVEPPLCGQTPGNWQKSLRRYENQAPQVSPLSKAFPQQSRYGALPSDTQVKGVVGRTILPQPDTAEHSYTSHESESSDRAPLCPPAVSAAKRAKKRGRNSP